MACNERGLKDDVSQQPSSTTDGAPATHRSDVVCNRCQARQIGGLLSRDLSKL